MKIIDNIKKHPIIASLLFGAAILSAIASYRELWVKGSEALENWINPSSFTGEICDIQHSACYDPSPFLKVIDKEVHSIVELHMVIASPPSDGGCEPSLQEFYDENYWHPVSLDTNPEDGCDNEILISKTALKMLSSGGGATYYRIDGEFSIVNVDGAFGPISFKGLKEI